VAPWYKLIILKKFKKGKIAINMIISPKPVSGLRHDFCCKAFRWSASFISDSSIAGTMQDTRQQNDLQGVMGRRENSDFGIYQQNHER